jgi:hypothetical protein
MPTIQIYLNQELFDFVKKNKSRIIQQALTEYKEKLTAKKRCSSPNTDATDHRA